MEVLDFTEVAENWLRSLDEVNEHRLKAIVTEILEGVLRAVVGEGMIRDSYYVHPPLFLVTDL